MSLNHQVGASALNIKVEAVFIPFTGNELSELIAIIERCESRVYRISGAEVNNPTAEGFIDALRRARQHVETLRNRMYLVQTLQDQPLQQSNHANYSPIYFDLSYELPLGWNDTLVNSLQELSAYYEAMSDVQRRWFTDCVEMLIHHNQVNSGTSCGTGRAYVFQVAKSCMLEYLASS